LINKGYLQLQGTFNNICLFTLILKARIGQTRAIYPWGAKLAIKSLIFQNLIFQLVLFLSSFKFGLKFLTEYVILTNQITDEETKVGPVPLVFEFHSFEFHIFPLNMEPGILW